VSVQGLPSDTDVAPYIGHDEFRAGLAHGRFRIVVNPALARPYVIQRTRVNAMAVVAIGAGAVLALAGQPWVGLLLVALGMAASRLIRSHAGKIVLHLALRDAAVYRDVTASGIMEVRRTE
jgi:hypothetical protein